MKKILVCIIIFAILISGIPHKEFSLLDYFEGDYVSYTSSPVGDSYIDLGTCYMNYVKPQAAMLGESITIRNFEPAAAIKALNAKIVKTEHLEDGATIIYAYSSLIPKNVKAGKKKVNLQIAHYETYSVVGWPLILGSY